MSTRAEFHDSRGFSLVELLVVMVIMGLVMASVYSLSISTQRNATVSDEVVEVQQNLRIAIDQITRDLRMAGFLVPEPAFSEAGTGNSRAKGASLAMLIASSAGRYARIGDDVELPASATATKFPIADADMLAGFDAGKYVRIVRPRDFAQPLAAVCQVQAVQTADSDTDPLYLNRPTIALNNCSATSPSPLVFKRDDIILRVPSVAAPFPGTIEYRIEQDGDSADANMNRLIRVSSGTSQVLAHKITGLRFEYILKDNTEQKPDPAVPAEAVAADLLDDIAAVRVTITGATDQTRAGSDNLGGVKTRQMETIVQLRNN